MLQDLISAHLISDYTVVEVPGSVNDLEGTRRVRTARYRNYFPLFVTDCSIFTDQRSVALASKKKRKNKKVIQ